MTHKANINIMLITASLLLVTISVTGSGSTDTGTSATMLSFTAQDLKVVAGKTGEAVFICDEVQWLNRAGEPRIPWKVLTVLLPPDVEPSSVSACTEAIRYEPIDGTWKVSPTAPMVTWHNGRKIVSWPEDKTLVDGEDVDIYRRDALWPEADVRLNRDTISQIQSYQVRAGKTCSSRCSGNIWPQGYDQSRVSIHPATRQYRQGKSTKTRGKL